MAASVFGTPITYRYLQSMDEFKDNKSLTRADLANMAMEMKNEGGKDVQARQYVDDLRKTYAIDYFLCLIYNATGDGIRLEATADRDLYVSPSAYPVLIANGQWGAFLKRGTGGVVVFSAINSNANEYQVLFLFGRPEPGRCYTEIRRAKYYKPKDAWSVYAPFWEASRSYTSQVHSNGLSCFASVGGTTLSPIFEGIVTHPGTWTNPDTSINLLAASFAEGENEDGN